MIKKGELEKMKKVHLGVILAGAAVGLAALILTALGNPTNMGFCIACFLRDISGAVGLHSAAKVQYVRPEIIGLVLGAFIMSVASKEFKARAGSSPAIRFVLGAFVVIGALAFLGCPLRMVLRLGGGDLNALVGLIGFTGGILLGIASLKKGFSLKRSYEVHKLCLTKKPCLLEGAETIDTVEGTIPRENGEVSIASYMNFLIVNGAVILPQYGDENDLLAVRQVQEMFPDREVVGVQTREVAFGGGNIHCITQQQPKTK